MLTRLNDLYDARRERLLAAHDRLQPSVWSVVLLGGLISLLFCWMFGTPHRRFHLGASALVAATFGLVIFLIVSRSEEHTSELQSLMRISYAVFCLKKQKKIHRSTKNNDTKQNQRDKR